MPWRSPRSLRSKPGAAARQAPFAGGRLLTVMMPRGYYRPLPASPQPFAVVIRTTAVLRKRSQGQFTLLGHSGPSDTRLKMSASDRKPECYQPTSVRGGVRLSGRLYAMRRIDRVLVQRRAGDVLGLCLSLLPACSTPAATEVVARGRRLSLKRGGI